MSELVVFPDVEAALVGALRTPLEVPVATRVPTPRPATFVRIDRVGGSRPNLVTDRAMVVLEAWGTSGTAAARLCAQLRAQVWALAGERTPDGTWVRRVQEIAGPGSYPDPETGSPRYQLTVQIDVRPIEESRP